MPISIQLPRETIHWAAEMLDADIDTLPDIVEIKDNTRREKFLNGEMSKAAAVRLAEHLNVPFGFLYLKTAPKLWRPKFPDFRTTTNKIELDDTFYDLLKDVQDKISWYKDYLASEHELKELPFVGKFTIRNNPEEVAADIEATIGKVTRSANFKTYTNNLAAAFERIGILVFQNGVLFNTNSKKLNPCMFRGFAIADKHVPAIFINTVDAESAQVFTLLHEIAHIWIKQDGVSNDNFINDTNRTEKFCNKVAANYLMPNEEFKKIWNQFIDNTDMDKLRELSKHFKVSRFVIAIKAFEDGLIYQDTINEVKKDSLQKSNKNGGNFHNTLPQRFSKRLTNLIIRRAQSNQMLLRDAAEMLHVNKITTIMNHKVKD